MKMELSKFKELIMKSNNKKIINRYILNIETLEETKLISVLENFYNKYDERAINMIIEMLGEYMPTDNEVMIESVKEFQNKNNKIELEPYEFVDLLKFCKIRVPRCCYSVLKLISNDETMETKTFNKRDLISIYNAYDKLMKVNF